MILFLIFLDISQLFSTNVYLIPTHQSEREKANFLWDTWSQSATYFQTAAHAQSGVTCSEESAVCPLLHTWDHNTHDWLVPLWLTGEREYSPHTQSSQPILLSWTPDWNIIWIQACNLQLIRWTFFCCTTFFFYLHCILGVCCWIAHKQPYPRMYHYHTCENILSFHCTHVWMIYFRKLIKCSLSQFQHKSLSCQSLRFSFHFSLFLLFYHCPVFHSVSYFFLP